MAWYRNVDWTLIISWISLTVVGLFSIYSATQGPVSEFLPAHIQQNFGKQLFFVGIALGVMIVIQFTAPRTFQQIAWLFYAFTLILMIFTLFFGIEVNGAKSWLSIFGVRFQVSELAKMSTILAVANYLTSRRNVSAERLGTALVAVLLIIIPALLILKQNDTGTALVLLAITPIMLFWSGLPNGISLYIISPAIIGYFSVLQWYWGLTAALILTVLIFIIQKRVWLTVTSLLTGLILVLSVNIVLNKVLQPHQKARIEAFKNPYFDPKGDGWNVIQAQTAIGSGGLTGKGFLQGTQTQLRFLPEQWTDFIFCVIGEEFGFVGSVTVLLLFLTMMLKLLNEAGSHKHPFAQLVLVGVTSIFFIHMFINIASATGLLPVIGIPLPFVSYGGSAFMSNTLMLAICINMIMYEREFSIYA